MVVNVDGGSRGNPGEAAAAAVVTTPDGEELTSRGERLGVATNNVAEYRAMLLGIQLARELGASEVDLVGDSELVVKQLTGEYKVKKRELQPLWMEVRAALRDFDDWTVRHVRREENAAADALVNDTLDG